MTSNTRVVVVGAGLAGVTLARRLGELGTPALVVGDEQHPVVRPGCCAAGSPASTGPGGPSAAPTAP
jgi:flavin-dependent dehydrogenase